MSVPHRPGATATQRTDPASQNDPATGTELQTQTDPTPPRVSARAPGTRTGAVWTGLCAGLLMLVLLIVFMLQNTRSVEVTFLWMHGTLPLAMALLIAGVGVAVAVAVVGTARTTQLRRQSRRG